MRTEDEIRAEINYLKGYIAGQRNSITPSEKEIEIASYEIGKLEWVLEEGEE